MATRRSGAQALAQKVGERIGYSFRDPVLVQRALTHSSVAHSDGNYERLEFLGDRVLSLVIADMLFRALPDAPEGELAPRFNALVDGRTCAEIAAELGLDDFVRGAAGLRGGQSARVRNYLADAIEALIAAIYLDGGIEEATAFIRRHWQPRSRAVVLKPRNPKSELQEWLAQTSRSRPEYAIEKREGPDHDPIFTVVVSAPGFDPARATGRSRQAAEEAAATGFLVREGVWADSERTP